MFQFGQIFFCFALIIIATMCAHAQKSEKQCTGENEFWGCQSPTRECQRLCENYKQPASECKLKCFRSCVCVAGYRRQGINGECVFETECQITNIDNNNNDQNQATLQTEDSSALNDTKDGLDKIQEYQNFKDKQQKQNGASIEEIIMKEGNDNFAKKTTRPPKNIKTTQLTKDEHDEEEEEEEEDENKSEKQLEI